MSHLNWLSYTRFLCCHKNKTQSLHACWWVPSSSLCLGQSGRRGHECWRWVVPWGEEREWQTESSQFYSTEQQNMKTVRCLHLTKNTPHSEGKRNILSNSKYSIISFFKTITANPHYSNILHLWMCLPSKMYL